MKLIKSLVFAKQSPFLRLKSPIVDAELLLSIIWIVSIAVIVLTLEILDK
jgi:hypothetical protein